MNPVQRIGSTGLLPSARGLYQKFIVPYENNISLSEIDPEDTAGFTEEVAKEITKANAKRLDELLRMLCASEAYALLVLLQGVNTAGKDGTIRAITSEVTPQMVEVTSFKAPTELEKKHDTLWRIHQNIPPRGMMGIFHRTHYEDIIVPKIKGQISENEVKLLERQRNDFERMLTENKVQIAKFILHISKKEQWKRLIERLEDPRKRHKFNAADFEDQLNWEKTQKAYEDVIRNCSTPWAPFFVIPGDHKWFRNLAISQILVQILEGLDLKYPDNYIEISDVKIKKLRAKQL